MALWKPQYMRPTGGYTDNFWEEEAEYAASSDKNLYSPLEGFSFDATDVKTEVAQRNQIFGDAQKLLEVGLAGDTDTALEKIKTDSEGAGFQSVLDEYQRQIDEIFWQQRISKIKSKRRFYYEEKRIMWITECSNGSGNNGSKLYTGSGR